MLSPCCTGCHAHCMPQHRAALAGGDRGSRNLTTRVLCPQCGVSVSVSSRPAAETATAARLLRESRVERRRRRRGGGSSAQLRRRGGRVGSEVACDGSGSARNPSGDNKTIGAASATGRADEQTPGWQQTPQLCQPRSPGCMHPPLVSFCSVADAVAGVILAWVLMMRLAGVAARLVHVVRSCQLSCVGCSRGSTAHAVHSSWLRTCLVCVSVARADVGCGDQHVLCAA